MSTNASPTMVAFMVALAGTFAILACAYLWAVTTTRPVRVRPHLTGRASAPYRYSPTRLQDELRADGTASAHNR